MINFIIYTIEVTICMFLFYSAWVLFMRKETYNRLNRFYLLATFILSFIIPALNIQFNFFGSQSSSLNYLGTIKLQEIIVLADQNSFKPSDWIFIIYLSIVLFLSVRFSIKLIQIFLFKKKCKKIKYRGVTLYVTNRKIAPFSFNNKIFFFKEDLYTEDFNKIISHELTHVKQKHSYDIILSEITGIIQWFNPMIYIYKRHLKTLHEYLSDEKVILQGFEPDEYNMLLIKRQIGQQFNFANYFNKSLTLKRIKMIKRIKSQKRAKYKILTAIPVLLIAVMLFSFSNKYSSTENVLPQVKDTIYTEVDEMAQYPGGNLELRKYIALNIKYPADARKNGISGTVFVKFIVNKKGKVGSVTIQKGVSESLDKESIRVVKSLPDFEKPAYKGGKPVAAYYITPITYKLQ